VKLGIDESMDRISLAETLDTICSVFPDTTAQVAGYSDVQLPVSPVGKDVNARSHAATMMLY
jgi:hypothetical protein